MKTDPRLVPVAPGTPPRAHWGAVFAMALSAFVLVASEFMPVSLLTPFASNLHITEGQAGQAISISGAFALITSLLVSPWFGHRDRKRLLLTLTLLMVLSGTVAATASDYGVFLVARALIGVAIGGFWSLSAATAMHLVPDEQVPRALAVLNGGNALASVLAAPLGSFLGGIIGWRGAFFCVVPIAAAAFFWKWSALPAMPARARPSTRGNPLALLKRPIVSLGMAGSALFFMGQFTLFTYLRPFLESVTHVNAGALSLLLLIVGLAGLGGTMVIGRFLQRAMYQVLAGIPVVMACLAIALILLGQSVAMTAVLLALWGLVATAAPVGWWTWLARTLPDDAEAGGGLMVAIVQLAIMLGASVGGLLFDWRGYGATFTASAVVLVAAALLPLLAARAATQNARSPARARRVVTP